MVSFDLTQIRECDVPGAIVADKGLCISDACLHWLNA
jgi:hypothetical protein